MSTLNPELRHVDDLGKHFPFDEKYRILIHAHAGNGNTQDAAGIEAALNGGNGVWSAVIPQARAMDVLRSGRNNRHN